MTDRFVTLVRHGEVEGGDRFRGPSDEPLSARGRAQLEHALATNERWSLVLTSPARRCHEPAEALARRIGVELRVMPELAERGFGAWHGQSAAEIAPERLMGFYADPDRGAPEDAEPLDAFQARARRAWQQLLALHGDLLVLTHGGMIRALVAEVLGIPASHLALIEVPPACRTRIRVPEAPGRPSLMSHGEFG